MWPVLTACSKASRLAKANISTSLVLASCAMTGMSPSGWNFKVSSQLINFLQKLNCCHCDPAPSRLRRTGDEKTTCGPKLLAKDQATQVKVVGDVTPRPIGM